MKNILCIGGSDSSGFAGLQADQRVSHAHGLHTLFTVTAVTSQSIDKVEMISPMSTAIIQSQIKNSVSNLDISCVKSGMIPSASAVNAIASVLNTSERAFAYVLDPVLQTSSGANLIDISGKEALVDQLFPIATVITPNVIEAEVLTGHKIENVEQQHQAAQSLLQTGCRAVLIKGGHLTGNQGTDLLLLQEQPDTAIIIEGTAVQDRSVRGTGCAYATAIACGLAEGNSLVDSVQRAKQFIQRAIEQALLVPGNGWLLGP